MAARALLLVPAILAALVWAPPPASAASNTLVGASASPGTGLTTTTFVLRVDYEGRFAASGVTVSVAGIALPMKLESGTAVDGRWRAATLLPAGTWATTFAATVERGNAPTLTGPTISVTVPLTPAPTPKPTPQPAPATPVPPPPPPPSDGPGAEEQPGGVADATEPPAAPAGGEPLATAAADGAPDEPAVSSPPADGPGTSPATPGPRASASGSGGPAEDGPDAALAGATDPSATAATAELSRLPGANDDLVMTVLVIGMSGVAAVALIGSAVLLAGRRRREPDEEPAPTDGQPSPSTPGARLRAMRRSAAADDPILASLGLDAPREGRPRRRHPARGRTPPPDER